MEPRLSRRDALKNAGIATIGTIGLARTGASAAEPTAANAGSDSPAKLSAYLCDRSIWVRVNDAVFTCYRANQDQKYPYFYPLAGPLTGLSVTDESGLPWPHHRSMFFGCDHVNGANYWQDTVARGQIVSRGPKIESADEKSVEISDVCGWRSPEGKDIIEDRRSYRISCPQPDVRIMDCRFNLTALTEIQIAKTNHSLFAIRAARELTPSAGGTLLNSAGQSGEKATFGQPAIWCGFEGTRFGHTETIALMDHPANPWFPGKWFTRDYGFASPTPFFWIDEPWKLPEGESLQLTYRVVVLAGPLDKDRLEAIHKSWTVPA